MICRKWPVARVGVFDHDGKYLENAQARLEDVSAGGNIHHLQWDRARGFHLAHAVRAGTYRLIAEAPGYESEARQVQVEAAGIRTVILLGTAGLPFLCRGGVKTPFRPQPDLFAIALDDKLSSDAEQKMDAVVDRHDLKSKFEFNSQPPRHARVFQFGSGSSPASRLQIVQDLVQIEGVHRLGPLVHFDGAESISCLTDELVVRFRPQVTVAQVEEIAARRNLTMLRTLAVAANLLVFRMPGPPSYDMLDLANEIAREEPVVYAEPNLVSIGVHDCIRGSQFPGALQPTDFLFPMQWHLALIRCPPAWTRIARRITHDVAMGRPEITIAVVDWGIDVGHPEFAGTVSNGERKISAVFDFHNMAASNNGRSHGHGTCCAGVATASANNGGVCGAAPNCRLMAIRRPEGVMATETAYSDMYLWIAGFDPESPAAGFPAPIAPGADVISNSFGYAAGLPISGLMQDTFDLLTQRGRGGRGGRGVLLFFSTGNNDPPVDFTLLRPWAAHAHTLAVNASTLAPGGTAEVLAKQSNFGGLAVLDFCAPSATSTGALHDAPRTYTIITAADRDSSDPDANLQPNAPSECACRTTTRTQAARGDTGLEVVRGKDFYDNRSVLIGTAGNPGAEFGRIETIPSGDTRFELQEPLKNPHAPGTAICGGPTESLHSFSGTSAATALAAGVGALVLSARPELDWREARDVLRRTAVKIDAASAAPTTIWRDARGTFFGNGGYRGPHYSRGYGFGRIDALAAVTAAPAPRTFWAKAAACVTAALRFRRCGGGDT